MKTKPVIIIGACIIAFIAVFLFVRSKRLANPEKAEVMAFLNQFNGALQLQDTKLAATFFDESIDKKTVNGLVNVLSNKTGLGTNAKPLFKLDLNTEDSEINFSNPELAEVFSVVHLNYKDIPESTTTLTFTLHKTGPQQFKIFKVDAAKLAATYTAFQNNIINLTVPEEKLFSPQTLAAFKIAESLKSRYDSILWFQQINNKPWFYVTKGKLPESLYWPTDAERAKPEYKMGLVNADLKEVIPVEYDLIHNIGGTIDGLIEVEKGDKKGFYSTEGKLIVPVNYEQILPLNDDDNIALLKNGADYSYLKKDLTTGEPIADFKIADILPKIKHYGDSYKVDEKTSDKLLEYNSRVQFTSLIISPSYLAEWHMMPKFLDLPDKLRHPGADMEGDGEGYGYVEVKFSGEQKSEDNWFTTAFYSVLEDYLGGRGGLYENRAMLLVDKKQNRILGFDASSYHGNGEGGAPVDGICRENFVKAINDTLFEFKTTSTLFAEMYAKDTYLDEGPYYHYLELKGGKLVAKESSRLFPTQFVKLDDSYLAGCYSITNGQYDEKLKQKTLDHLTPEMLQYMKNEIYASYHYKFKNQRWDKIFDDRYYVNEKDKNVSVEDSLTAIDKYNINWINSKLNPQKPAVLAAQ
ncbi:YARHG domain-containing protein [Mucilaginibacter conchicola]|uniref:YARHG domain-containing protein n=1 Tax=Mucilaginibacter conchicola TaxID=2303333 RepID=A0A372NU04_9SPHI|nr:YARHG domain-containing protein [Mucilaginibacter conchicola]RFZ92169.1 YARHG domain-containing protein [Mucilaginibacter conchicola]